MSTQQPKTNRTERVLSPSLRAIWSSGTYLPGAVRALEQLPLVVGRTADGGEWKFDDPLMSRRHASIHAVGQNVFVRDTSSGGTRVNGARIHEHALADGDLLRMGDTFFVFRRDDPTANAPQEPSSLVGASPTMRRLRATLSLLAPTGTIVLLLGETGTGKEVAARALHQHSMRGGPFVPVNCGAIPEGLAESQLFGHVAGAFTGARGESPGVFRAAHGGTIFLDEIGELPPLLQPKLLRALEERCVSPVGSTRTIPFDARVIAATNRNLLSSIANGEFRADLYSRLAEIVVEMPPLRERREDILPSLMHAFAEAGVEQPPGLSAALVEQLLAHRWPFNVREVVKVATLLRIRSVECSELDVDALDDRFRPIEEPEAARAATIPVRRPRREELERLLHEHQGIVTDVARALGRSRRQVYRWLERYGLDPQGFRDAGP